MDCARKAAPDKGANSGARKRPQIWRAEGEARLLRFTLCPPDSGPFSGPQNGSPLWFQKQAAASIHPRQQVRHRGCRDVLGLSKKPLENGVRSDACCCGKGVSRASCRATPVIHAFLCIGRVRGVLPSQCVKKTRPVPLHLARHPLARVRQAVAPRVVGFFSRRRSLVDGRAPGRRLRSQLAAPGLKGNVVLHAFVTVASYSSSLVDRAPTRWPAALAD